jgi:hypothetical protein
MTNDTTTEIAGIAVAGTLVFTSAYMSWISLDCSCDNKRVLVPNQLVMLMGVLGMVFTLCTCCFEKLDISPHLITTIPGVIALVASLSQMYSKCGCCKATTNDPDKTCGDGAKTAKCCIGSSRMLKVQIAVSLLMIMVGVGPMVLEHLEKSKAKPKLQGGGRRRKRRGRSRKSRSS